MADHLLEVLARGLRRSTRITMRPPLVLITAILLTTTSADAQDPLSLGGPLGQLVVQVTDDEGEPLPGVTVEASRAEGGPQVSFIADASGEVILRAPVGRYLLRVSQEGFAPVEKEVEIRTGTSSTVRLSLSGGPIPLRSGGGGPAPDVRRNSPPTLRVVEQHFSDDLALLGWLGELDERLELVVPLGDGTSLFLTSPRSGTDYIATPVTAAPSRAAVQARLDANPNRRFCGVHVINGSSYVMVFADE